MISYVGSLLPAQGAAQVLEKFYQVGKEHCLVVRDKRMGRGVHSDTAVILTHGCITSWLQKWDFRHD